MNHEGKNSKIWRIGWSLDSDLFDAYFSMLGLKSHPLFKSPSCFWWGVNCWFWRHISCLEATQKWGVKPKSKVSLGLSVVQHVCVWHLYSTMRLCFTCIPGKSAWELKKNTGTSSTSYCSGIVQFCSYETGSIGRGQGVVKGGGGGCSKGGGRLFNGGGRVPWLAEVSFPPPSKEQRGEGGLLRGGGGFVVKGGGGGVC